MAPAKRGGKRAVKRVQAVGKESVMALRDMPSPPSAQRRRSGIQRPAPQAALAKQPPGRAAPADGIDLAKVEELAACGLTLEQIAVELGISGTPRPSLRVRMEAAIKRGRAKGSAKLKQAHYKAALKGSVTSLKEMLARLEAEESDDEIKPIEVRRVILDGADGEEKKTTTDS